MRVVAALLFSTAPALASAAPDAPPTGSVPVVFVGFTSPDLGPADMGLVETAVEDALPQLAPGSLGKASARAALLRNPEIARNRDEARAATDAGAIALGTFDFPAARREFDRAAVLYRAANAEWIAPAEVARLHEQRAALAYGLRQPDAMREEFARLVYLQSVKTLDEKVFAPDAITIYREEAARAKRAPRAIPNATALSEVARRASARGVVVGEVRILEGALDVHLVLCLADGTVVSEEVQVPSKEALESSLSGALRTVLSILPEPTPTPRPPLVAVVPAPVATARPVPAKALPTATPVRTPALDSRKRAAWFVLAGALGIGAFLAAGVTTSQSNQGGGSGSDGVDVVLDPP